MGTQIISKKGLLWWIILGCQTRETENMNESRFYSITSLLRCYSFVVKIFKPRQPEWTVVVQMPFRLFPNFIEMCTFPGFKNKVCPLHIKMHTSKYLVLLVAKLITILCILSSFDHGPHALLYEAITITRVIPSVTFIRNKKLPYY